ncbi:hypothetical protein O181_022568 [Austropuccinia psidii MF-1]|uniref:Uncharacterized protein n=1 Tax=Austropuccinia psidii MF-1 TaxID=1389203 RepID=A0A9Q3CFF2_9BASI|nr:hypothetical protein [Austropuccinia psidii MF-1]
MTLIFQQTTKWLGIHLDSKCNFGKHISQLKKESNLTINQLRQIIKTTYGLNPKEPQKLVPGVLPPRLLIGSIIWFTNRNKRKVDTWLDKISGIGSTSTQKDHSELTFEKVKHFQSPIHEIIDKDLLHKQHGTPIEKRTQHTIPPWADPLPMSKNLVILKEEVAAKITTQLEDESENESLILFTDGSLTEGQKAGAAV